MTCHDFERRWNLRLDALRGPDGTTQAATSDLDAHARACPECRARHERMRTLEHAIGLWSTRPGLPAAMASRLVAGCERPEVRVRALDRPLVRLALAAAVVATSALTWTFARPDPRKPTAPELASTAPTLEDALAGATGATIGLARATSAPAGRLGRAMLDLAAPLAAETPDLMPQVGIDPTPAPGRMRAMVDRVGAGLVPISGTARRAFGFLLMQPPDAAGPPAGHDGRNG
jgi:hypothetical protein